MPKATIDDIKDIGFQSQQFGLPEDWDIEESSGFLENILADVGVDVRNHVSNDVYNAADNSDGATDEQLQNFVTIKRAEINLVAAELWSRRMIYLESGMGRSIEDISGLMAEYRRNAQAKEEKAWSGLAFLSGRKRSGSFSTGVNVSGLYPKTI